MTFRVRPFAADRDYVAFARIHSIAEGQRVTPEEARAEDSLWDWSYEKVRVVAVDEEDVALGYGEIYHEPARFDPRRYFVRLAVEPRLRRRGVGAAIWDHLAAELDERRARIACLWIRDHTACVDFMAKRGFREVVRAYRQVLAVATAPLPTPATRERLADRGVRIATLEQLVRSDPEAARKAHELNAASRDAQVTLGPVTSVPFPQWRHVYLEDPFALRDAFFIALEGDAYVGQTTAFRSKNAEDVLEIGITGVLPAYRRLGIARALKLELHAYARAHGYREIHTSTASGSPMDRLNTQLGYVVVESQGGYELLLRHGPEGPHA